MGDQGEAGQVLIHYHFNPDKTHNLSLVAESIEAWAQSDYQQNVQPGASCCAGNSSRNYSLVINNIEVRGTNYDRQAFETLSTASILHNEEPFTMRVRVSGRKAYCTIL